LLFPDKMGQPRMDFSILGTGDEFKVLVEMYYSMCTLNQQLVIAMNFTDCEMGIKEDCLARNLPTPCVVCDTAEPSYIPDDSYLIGLQSEMIFRSLSTAGLLLGCNYGLCQYYLQAVPLDFGEAECDFGALCVANSSVGAQLGEVVYVNDASADELYVLYLALIVAAIFSIAGLVVAAAAAYKFKAVPNPKALDPAVISWRDVGLNNVISNMGGKVGPGQFVAILGTVGAGKSTLLKVLAGRLHATSGDVCLNEEKVSASDLRRIVGFVPQDQICCPRDTVAEAISFAATMCGGAFPEVGVLAEKLPERIGTLSGGQRRLVDIYVELARRPSVLLLDEPTTGLDSETALILGKLLKEISKQIPVIATIHQPRPEFAQLFTDVMVFASGKQVCTGGAATGHASAMDALMSICRSVSKTEAVYRTSCFDFAVELASDGVELNSVRDNLQVRASKKGSITSVNSSVRRSITGMQFMVKKRKTPMFIKQMVFLAIRNSKRALRHGPFKYIVTMAISLLLGVSFFQVDTSGGGLRNRFSVLFLVHAFFALQGISATGEQMEVFSLAEHEIKSHVYSRRVDAFVRVLSQFAGQLPHALILTLIVYPMVGLRPEGGRPLIFMLCMMSSAIAGACCALLARGRIVGIAGVIAAAALNGVLSFLCGAFTNTDDMIEPLKWLLAISPFRYSFEVVVAHELIGLQSEIVVQGQPVAISAGGEYYLEALSLPAGFGDELSLRVKLVAIVTLIWAFLAFIMLSLPAHWLMFQRGLRRTDGSGEVSVNNLCQQLESWDLKGVASNQTDETGPKEEDIPVSSDQAAPDQPNTSRPTIPAFGAKHEQAADDGNNEVKVSVEDPPTNKQTEGEEKVAGKVSFHETAAEETKKDNITELVWSGLSNPDTKDLAGGVRTGQLLGIVGPCGSGKTTLLKMLCGRVQPAAGSITINGQAVTARQLRAIVGYVPQEEWMCLEDTVSEALAFAAGRGVEKKKLSSRNSLIAGAHLQNKEEMEQQLGALSQGQRRITAVCAELARRPLAMMLDEPTSGLDTASSMRLTQLLKGVSKRVPVIMTLHQPRVEMQNLLSHVLIMRRGESAVFMKYRDLRRAILPSPAAPLSDGGSGDAKKAAEEAEAAKKEEEEEARLDNEANKPKEDDEASEHSMFDNAIREERDKKVNEHAEMTTTTLDLALEQLDSLAAGGQHRHAFAETPNLSSLELERQRPSVLFLASGLTRRALRRTWYRKPRAACAMIATWFLAAVLLGLSMHDQLKKTSEGIVARLGLFFVINSIIGILTLPYIYDFNHVRSNILHELESQVASPFLYHCCHTFVACTERLPCAVVFSAVVLLMVDLNPAVGSSLIFMLLVYIVAVVCILLATALASMMKHTLAVNSYNGILVFMMIFGASFMATDPGEEVPPGNQVLDILQYGSFLSYAYEAQLANELIGLTDFSLMVAKVEVSKLSGEEWLEELHIPNFIGWNIIILLGWAGLLWCIGAIGLRNSTLPQKRAAKNS